jgi:hypothetical protein
MIAWQLWHNFCCELNQDSLLYDVHDPIPLLMVFARRYRTGVIAPSGAPVRARTVEEALHSVGQTLALLGFRDPRLQPSRSLDLRLNRQLKAYSRIDPPPPPLIELNLYRYRSSHMPPSSADWPTQTRPMPSPTCFF